MVKISQGIGLGQAGERAAAREVFSDLWDRIGADGDPFYRCAVAHSMADVQDDLNDELAWDLRALHAADLVTNDRVREAGVMSPAAAFYPSLHLNLGEVYRKLGDLDRARFHLSQGQAALGVLGDDGYGQIVKGGLDGLANRLSPSTG